MTRIPFVCGNWKMHNDLDASVKLAQEVAASVAESKIEVAIAPTFLSLSAVSAAIQKSRVKVAAQNCHFEASGPFTGEVSAPMAKAVGCDYVILGHSERRQYFGETNEGVNRRLKAVLAHQMSAIVCVGETLADREAGRTEAVVTQQLEGALAAIDGDKAANIVIAYEPVWAIGTGKTASAEQAQEVHRQIRDKMARVWSAHTAQGVRIQYGGSVKPGNAQALLSEPDIDGALVGGASLKAADFAAIVAAAPHPT